MDTLVLVLDGVHGVHGLRDWFYVTGLMGFGLVTMTPVFWVLWKWGPEVGKEAGREWTWLTPPLDKSTNEEETNDELELDTVGRRVHSQLAAVAVVDG